MQSNTMLWSRWLLPWIAGAVLILPGCNRRDADLAATREKELESTRAELEQTKAHAAVLESDLTRLRKDTQELPRLRNEVRQLREDNRSLAKQMQSARAEAQRAEAQTQTAQAAAQGAQAQAAEMAEAELQHLATASQQTDYEARINAIVDAAGGLATPEGQAAAACLNNLRQIDGAKQQWALQTRKADTAIPTPEDLARYIRGGILPTCPAGGTYTLNAVNANPTCSIPGHALPPP